MAEQLKAMQAMVLGLSQGLDALQTTVVPPPAALSDQPPPQAQASPAWARAGGACADRTPTLWVSPCSPARATRWDAEVPSPFLALGDVRSPGGAACRPSGGTDRASHRSSNSSCVWLDVQVAEEVQAAHALTPTFMSQGREPRPVWSPASDDCRACAGPGAHTDTHAGTGTGAAARTATGTGTCTGVGTGAGTGTGPCAAAGAGTCRGTCADRTPTLWVSPCSPARAPMTRWDAEVPSPFLALGDVRSPGGAACRPSGGTDRASHRSSNSSCVWMDVQVAEEVQAAHALTPTFMSQGREPRPVWSPASDDCRACAGPGQGPGAATGAGPGAHTGTHAGTGTGTGRLKGTDTSRDRATSGDTAWGTVADRRGPAAPDDSPAACAGARVDADVRRSERPLPDARSAGPGPPDGPTPPSPDLSHVTFRPHQRRSCPPPPPASPSRARSVPHSARHPHRPSGSHAPPHLRRMPRGGPTDRVGTAAPWHGRGLKHPQPCPRPSPSPQYPGAWHPTSHPPSPASPGGAASARHKGHAPRRRALCRTPLQCSPKAALHASRRSAGAGPSRAQWRARAGVRLTAPAVTTPGPRAPWL